MKNTLLLVLSTLHNLSYHTTGLPESMDLGWSLEPDFFFGHANWQNSYPKTLNHTGLAQALATAFFFYYFF